MGNMYVLPVRSPLSTSSWLFSVTTISECLSLKTLVSLEILRGFWKYAFQSLTTGEKLQFSPMPKIGPKNNSQRYNNCSDIPGFALPHPLPWPFLPSYCWNRWMLRIERGPKFSFLKNLLVILLCRKFICIWQIFGHVLAVELSLLRTSDVCKANKDQDINR